MECRAYGICLDSQSRGYLGKDRKVSSAAGGNLSRMHKTQETAKESRLNFMYSHLRNRTLAGLHPTENMSCSVRIGCNPQKFSASYGRANPRIVDASAKQPIANGRTIR